MNEFLSADIRSFALVGHGASGKTMLSEAMLFNAGETTRIGTIEAGTTISDYHPDEHERQISIHATPLHLTWLDKKLNLIDTPGYMDFIGESLGSLAVVDMAVIVVHAVQGIEVGTEQMWSKATDYAIPKVLVLNGLDREHTKFDEILEEARERFDRNVFPIQIPMNSGPGFNQILDVLRKEVHTYKSDGSGGYTVSNPEGEWAQKADELHNQLIELIAESDDALLEQFFDQGNLTEDEMRGGIHAAVQNQSLIPLYAVSASLNVGVQRFLDFVSKYGSSPIDRAQVKAMDFSGKEEVDVKLDGEDAVVQVFKTISEAHVGELSFFRIYSGKVKTGDDLLNTTRGGSERFGQISVSNGKSRINVNALHAGDIGAVVKLKNTHTGDTLTGNKFKVMMPETEYPNSNIHAALVTTAKGDEEKIAVGLSTLHEEDPTFKYRVDPEIRQTIISGQGELHLRVNMERLKRNFHVNVELIEPKVPYRETIRGRGDSKYRHKKQSGGAGQFAEVWMKIESKENGSGIEFTDSLHGQNVDRVFVPSVEKGVNAAVEEGVLAGYRVVDLKVDFYDGKQHPVDSKDIAFQIAGKQAFREAFMAAQPKLLEPIINIQIKVPEEYMGDVMGDVSGRRGKIMGMETDGNFQIINAQIPQAELYNYATQLRSITGGRGLHSEQFSHYEDMPREIEKKVIAESQKEKEED